MATPENEIVRLRVSPLTRWRLAVPVVTAGVFGIAIGIAGVSELLAKSSSITTLGKIVFVVLGALSLALGVWLLRTGTRLGRQASARVPVLEATPDRIRLERANRKPREVPRAKVVTASFEVHPGEGDGAGLSYLEWFDEGRRSLGVWTLDPVVNRPLSGWLRAIGVELTTDRTE